ncbi:hypothetical protein BDF21DRAFT_430191 [Thamnidium elegans]|nr:hypothetical protein BDF21DRAFT_430191 [Thamnidium elegans]
MGCLGHFSFLFSKAINAKFISLCRKRLLESYCRLIHSSHLLYTSQVFNKIYIYSNLNPEGRKSSREQYQIITFTRWFEECR